MRADPDRWRSTAAQRCADAEPRLGEQRAELSDPTLASGPLTALVAGVRVVANPLVDQPWATTAFLMAGPPAAAELAEILRWLADRAGRGYSVVTRLGHADDPRWAAAGLTFWESQPVFVASAQEATALHYPQPEHATLRTTDDEQEFWPAYDCWIGDLDASAILPAQAFGRPDWGFLVAEVNQEPVGSAIVRWVDATGYLSGIGVREDLRGGGIGGALTAAATSMAARGPNGDGTDATGRPIDLVWMHASTDGAPMYARLGFTEVDAHVILAHD